MSAIPDALISVIGDRLRANKRVRRTLPGAGRLHIDRQLPFLVVHRRPDDRRDAGTRRLVLGEASYLIASADEAQAASLSRLVACVADVLAEALDAVLLVEVWSAAPDASGAPEPSGAPVEDAPEQGGAEPAFRVVVPDQQAATRATDTLLESLDGVVLFGRAVRARREHGKTAVPPGLPPLLDAAEANRLRLFSLGLEVPPLYRDATDTVYPQVLRETHRAVSHALRRAFFSFAHQHTATRPAAFQALGRRAVVRAVGEVDEGLTAIGDAFDFLLAVTPVNLAAAWTRFQEGGFETPPDFRYRPLAVDPERLKRRLYAVPLEKVEDPTLARIFREKVRELDRQLTMLAERNTHRFLYGSLQLYGPVEDDLYAVARELLAALPAGRVARGATVDAEAFAALARAELDRYRDAFPDLTARVELRDDVTGLLVSRGDLLVGRTLAVPERRVDALLQHEVGTHALTYANGRAQPFGLLHTGLAGYEALQEGLAVLAEYLVGGLSRVRLRLLAARVVAARLLVEGALPSAGAPAEGEGFLATFRHLVEACGLGPAAAFRVAARVFRGGGLTKDAIYLRGLRQLLAYLAEGGRLDLLFLGKMALQHLPLLEELRYRQVLRAAPLTPRYLDRPEVAERLERVRDGVGPLELIPEET